MPHRQTTSEWILWMKLTHEEDMISSNMSHTFDAVFMSCSYHYQKLDR